jgi:transcriptional regulator with PAS, ATPase and Fis domain
MKRIPTFEQFVNEKVYRLAGYYSAKGLIGKIMQTFKKEIERTVFEGDREGTLEEVNKAWAKHQDTAKKLVLDQVEKAVKNMDQVLFVTMEPSHWIVDDVNGLNMDDRTDKVYIRLQHEFVINVGFMDDADSSKFKRKFDKESYNNTPLSSSEDLIYGTYDDGVGDNNLELRSNEIIEINHK